MEESALIELYKEQMAYCRHNEAQRGLMTNLLLVISAVILGFMFHQGKLTDNVPLSSLLIVIGVFGVFFSRKHYERWCFHDRLSDEYRKLLEEKYPSIVVDRKPIEESLMKEYRFIHLLPLNFLWTIMPFIIAIIGVVTTTIMLTSTASGR